MTLDSDTVTLSFAVGLVTVAISAVIWLNKKFDSLKDFVQKRFDELLDKLNYHERHDDQRFSQVNNELWQVRLDLALKDKTIGPKENYPTLRRENSETSSG